jgi:Na+-transporting NADH:ubiquinone oxidoreductase subunit B
MYLFQRFFDTLRPHVESGGRFEKLYPFYESIESIFFSPDQVTTSGPHVRDSLDVKRFMTLVILCLIPHFLFGIYNAGFQARLASGQSLSMIPVIFDGLILVMPLVVTSYAVGFFWEILFSVVRKHAISEGLFVSAMLFPLTLPPTVPVWQAALGISFGIVIGKEVFGGTGRNFLNPALTARAFLFFAYPAQMSGDSVWIAASSVSDAVSGATPLAIAAALEAGHDIVVTLESAGFTLSKLLSGLYPGTIGGTSAALCVLSAIFLIAIGVASYRIIIGGILGLVLTGLVLNVFSGPHAPAWFSMNPFYHLILGGAAFGLTFMATDPVTSPDMNHAKWIYGFLIGMLTILIRVFNPAFPEGMMLAILFMNVFAPLLDYVEIKMVLKKRVPNV